MAKKKLTGEKRIDALVLELKEKHGFHFSPAVMGEAVKDDEAREAETDPDYAEFFTEPSDVPTDPHENEN